MNEHGEECNCGRGAAFWQLLWAFREQNGNINCPFVEVPTEARDRLLSGGRKGTRVLLPNQAAGPFRGLQGCSGEQQLVVGC